MEYARPVWQKGRTELGGIRVSCPRGSRTLVSDPKTQLWVITGSPALSGCNSSEGHVRPAGRLGGGDWPPLPGDPLATAQWSPGRPAGGAHKRSSIEHKQVGMFFKVPAVFAPVSHSSSGRKKRVTWIQIPAPLCVCATLGQLLNLSVPQFSKLKRECYQDRPHLPMVTAIVMNNHLCHPSSQSLPRQLTQCHPKADRKEREARRPPLLGRGKPGRACGSPLPS